MTSAQINYRQLLETTKHNRAQEDNWMRSLGETIRHDQAQEQLSKYSADTQAATSRYSAETNAAASRYSADKRAESSVYSTDVGAETSRYHTDVEHSDRQKRFELDALRQKFDTQMETARLKLQKLTAQSDILKRNAEISKISADMENMAAMLELKGRELDIKELRAEAQNALDAARRWEAYSKTGMNAAQILRAINLDFENQQKRLYKVDTILD